ncbi:MAG TPA: hypothetical protein VFM27_09840 [Acidimicrobiales bacterium]|nr:hypothetical protein [Acidimicrobiales bacterium]
MAATRCQDCDRPFGMSRRSVTTATGRRVCADCRDRVTAAAAGVLASPEAPVAGATATAGWFRRLTRRRHARD